MKKYSRKHGMMWLSSYAPGDGSIDFVWVKENDRNGDCLSEFVSESDISEWMESEGQKHKWRGWEIITIGRGPERHYPAMNRLAKIVWRPFGTSKFLQTYDAKYEYVFHGEEGEEHTVTNTTFYEVEDEDKAKVKNVGIQLGLCFFLKHTKDFERSGFQTRSKSREMVPA